MYTPEQIADELQKGAEWQEDQWRNSGLDEGDLGSFEALAFANAYAPGEAIALPAFTALLAAGIAKDRGADTVSAHDQVKALDAAEKVRTVFLDRGFNVPLPERWAVDRARQREMARAEVVAGSASLEARMETAFLSGYDERIRSGLAWNDAADESERDMVSEDVLAGKRAAYVELDALAATLGTELPDALARLNDPSVDGEPLTSNASAALERSAHLAGRWGGVDAGLDGALARIENRVIEVPQVESIHAGHSRDAWFEYRQDCVDAARAALPQIERRAAERSPGVSAAQTESTEERKTVLERMRGWSKARREASGRAGVDDVDRRRDAWQTAHGREMRTAGAAQRAPQRDVAQPAIDRGIER